MSDLDDKVRAALKPLRDLIHESCYQREAHLERRLAERQALAADAHRMWLAERERAESAEAALKEWEASYAELVKDRDAVQMKLAQAREAERLAKILLGRDWSVVIRVLRDQDMTGAASDLEDMVGALAALDAGKERVA